MSQKWTVVYYEDEKGNCPTLEFIEDRSLNNQAKIMALINLLEVQGPNLPRPYADFLTDGIHELRIKLSGDQSRFLYFFTFKNYIIITHAFIKNIQKVPVSEIKKARKYREDFLKRFTEEKLKRKLDDEEF
ncbi:type II toxin-antitoxin system RelE/ParE family toxin [Leptospira fletcheri]|uniref:Type II toxin-antitoxin system RelE/ParE family toxin n=1 Tax=Leptospira fletcheri TaxID=2484981 RepID=A0A4R9GEP4_9LEPT|nr:type II toxin-antitoxin system RelE/ParE family toxin [Leptospira fletcheri]TGK10259.1 type II toxin-antitoxin system RelE/ParE family toxin [Leptospira fletcheri]